MQDLAPRLGGREDDWCEATHINDSGQIVGRKGIGSEQKFRGFLLRIDGRTQELGQIYPAINNKGEIAGNLAIVERMECPVLWHANKGLQRLDTLDEGLRRLTGGGEWRLTSLGGFNDGGQVVIGAENGRGEQRVFLWQSGNGMEDIHMPPGEPGSAIALGINNRGQVVGFYGPPHRPGELPPLFGWNGFIYDNGVVTNLNNLIDPASGWHVEQACAINDLGQIVVRAVNSWTDDHGQWVGPGHKGGDLRFAALLLTPVP